MSEETNDVAIDFDIDHIKNRIIFGIPLVDTDGKPFPEDLFVFYLESAIAWAEQTLNIAIEPRELTEAHDFLHSDYVNWGFVKLHKKPILEVESLSLKYGDRPMMHIPADWLKVDKLAGAIQIFPTSGSSGGIIIGRSGALMLPLIGGASFVPQMWEIKYTAGMTEPVDSSHHVYHRDNIHPNLKEVIYKQASIGVLGVFGDLIIGAGIANQSISLDGVSQSIGTTQSAMYGGASARIEQLKTDIETHMPALRAYYGGIDLTVV